MTKQKPGSAGMQAQAMSADDAVVDPVVREQMTAVAACYLAEQHGVSSGQEMEGWLRAEKAIDSDAAGSTAET